jgi:hypothetical protein
MAKVHQNAQGRWNERQQAAGYAYGANAVKPEMLGRFPLGPGGVAPNPNAPLPDFAGPWGAGSKRKGGGGGGGGGGKAAPTPKKAPRPTAKPQQLPEGALRHVGGAGSGAANFAGNPNSPAPVPTPRPDNFSPDLAVSPNPYQMNSPVDPRMTNSPGVFQGPPIPPPDPMAGRDLLNNPPANPFMNDRDVLAALASQLAVDPTQTGSTAAPPAPRGNAVINPGQASGNRPILGNSPPVVGGSRPLIDVMKLFRGG